MSNKLTAGIEAQYIPTVDFCQAYVLPIGSELPLNKDKALGKRESM
jgi:hypothetical protein